MLVFIVTQISIRLSKKLSLLEKPPGLKLPTSSVLFVAIPFILMSLITAILLFVFGLNPSTGKMRYKNNSNTENVKYVYIDFYMYT